MNVLSLKDIIGPIMIGPSSSHTAGALRIAYMARKLCLAKPKRVEFRLLGSFAHTLTGHGTDKALVAGMLGFAADDVRIRDSFLKAQKAGLTFTFTPLPHDTNYDHPNTIDITVVDASGATLEVRGESTGGGAAAIRSIDGIEVYITGETTSIVVHQRDVAGVLAHIANVLSNRNINIATARMYRKQRGESAYTILETDHHIANDAQAAIQNHPDIFDVRIIPGDTSGGVACSLGNDSQTPYDPLTSDTLKKDTQLFDTLNFSSAAELLARCEQSNLCISDIFLAREKALASTQDREDITSSYLDLVLQVMKEAAITPLTHPLPSMGGLVGGEAQRLNTLRDSSVSVCDEQSARACTYAMAALETNASMGRIVAAPTAGASGVLPGVLLALQDTKGLSDSALKKALATAGAIGYLITRNATVSGAEGGCQAEVGSAAAMAAAAAAELMGASPKRCIDAAGNALMNLMGLVCDPVAGLVEVPCQKRNAAGAAVALVSAQIACAKIGNLIHFDQVVEAMNKVGHALPFELRESGLGGIAATPAACAWCASHTAR